MSSTFLTKLRPISIAIALMGMGSVASAQEFSQTVFFGDSLTDTGRLQHIGQNSFAFLLFGNAQNAFTTNPDTTWAGVLAKSYGHQAIANTTQTPKGTNYAVGGARADTNVSQIVFSIPSVKTQLDAYLKDNAKADPNALYSIWIGANDLIEAGKQTDQIAALATITQAAQYQGVAVDRLHQAGAKYILVPNLPDVGITPRNVNNPELSAQATFASQLYNQHLYQALNRTQANVIAANTFGLLQEAVADKQGFGFENVNDVACQNLDALLSSLSCTPANYKTQNANETYAFADDIHPSGRTHRILAQYYRSIIDSPQTIAKLPQHIISDGKHRHRQLHRQIDNLQPHRHSLWADVSVSNLQTGEHKDNSPNILAGLDILSHRHHTGAYLSHRHQDYTLSPTTQATLKHLGVGVYHKHNIDNLNLTADLGVDKLSVHTERQIAWDGAKRTHHADGLGRRVHASLRGSYDIHQGKATITPYVGVHAQKITINDLTENQAHLSTALRYHTQNQRSIQGEIGINAQYAINDKASVFGGIGHQHEFDKSSHDIRTSVTSIPSHTKGFALPVAAERHHHTHAHVGAKIHLGQHAINAGVNAIHQDGNQDIGGFIGLQAKF